MTGRTLLGVLTPSSNTIMEPVIGRILAGTPDVTAHFGRFRVTEISLGEAAMGQFDFEPQLAAADLLADARIGAIAWGGTSGGWVGIDNDRELCRRLTERTGAPATTSTLALLAALDALGLRDYALVTPYVQDVQDRIVENLAREGYRCAAERHLGDKGNFSFSEFGEEVIAEMIRAVAVERPGAIAIHCTNFYGTRIAASLEEELGIPVIDSIALTVWQTMQLAGADPRRIEGWGRLFAQRSGNGASG